MLIDIAVQVDPDIEVVFLDTGSHFPETLEYVETDPRRYDLNLDRDQAGGRRRAVALRDRPVLRVPQGPAAASRPWRARRPG